MQNRFKFRLYDKEKRLMLYEDSEILRTEKVYEYEELWWANVAFPIKAISRFFDYNSEERFVLQQCTGLKDKNEKLIFEGDIVKVPTQCNKELHGSYSLQEIVWRNGNWVLSYISSEKGRKLPRGWSACFLHDQWSDEYEKEFIFTNADIFQTYNMLEVVGNIYTNKELLEEQK